MAARCATTAGAGIALRASRRIHQQNVLFVRSRRDERNGAQISGPVGRIAPLKRRSGDLGVSGDRFRQTRPFATREDLFLSTPLRSGFRAPEVEGLRVPVGQGHIID